MSPGRAFKYKKTQSIPAQIHKHSNPKHGVQHRESVYQHCEKCVLGVFLNRTRIACNSHFYVIDIKGKVVPRAGIEPATRGFSRLVAKISFCFYCNKWSVFEVCKKLCNEALVDDMAIYSGQHSKLTKVLHHSKQSRENTT